MNVASACYLGFTIFLFVIFAAIVARTYRPKAKETGEAPKYRMLDDD